VKVLFFLATFLIYFALTPNLRVDFVSSLLSLEGDAFRIIVVFEFPPKLSDKILEN